MDGDDSEFLPKFPSSLRVKITGVDSKPIYYDKTIENETKNKNLFHNRAGIILIQGVTIPNEKVEITIN
jgi:hypothetical protein